jgi:hypothetical protein
MPTRREFLALAALAWSRALEAAQPHVHVLASAPESGAYAFRFLEPAERDTLQRLAVILVPADNRSGGARTARVEEYVDLVLAHAEPALQERWRLGLARYLTAPPETTEARLREAAAGEDAPNTDDEEFFVLLKDAVVEGFYTSEEGITKELGYQGLTFLAEFPGCTHAAHELPAGFRPRLRPRT